MNPWDIANRYLGKYKQHGDEIVPEYCPFCEGGARHDKWTFALNVKNQTYNCKRGSCGEHGHFSQLCKHFGEEMDRDDYMPRVQKTYVKPKSTISEAQKRVEDYLKLRGFSPDTWKRRGVGEVDGNIAFPYYENGELVLVKFRKPEKYNGKGMKSWRETGGKPVLWGMDLCDETKPLVIVEGEPDALSLDECGVENVVSVPSGAEDLTWIETCWDFLERFDKVILWGDSDAPGKKMVENVVRRIGDWRCYTVDAPKHKDANESLIREGKEKTAAYVKNAKAVPINGLIDLADVVPEDVSKIERVTSGISGIDHEIGGFHMGELSVWTGKSGQGKSTLIGQVAIEAIEHGFNVCAYSGELRKQQFQNWIHLQMAGPKHVETYFDQLRGCEKSYVPQAVREQMKNWYRGHFFLYDNESNLNPETERGIIDIFTLAARRYNCRVFIVDNLMTAKYDTGKSDKDFYRAQSSFVGELVAFSKSFNVHVHLVAHPKKTEGHLTKYDVSGSSDITNRADNVFSVERETKEELPNDTTVGILKNRSEGVQDVGIGLIFDKQTKRFYAPGSADAERAYGWERQYEDIPFA